MQINTLEKKITFDEYFEREFTSDFKSEYVNGEVISMAGASVKHNFIFKNTLISLELAIIKQNKSCFMIGSDQLLFVEECSSIYYPDLMMVCGKPEFYKHKKSGRMAILNPTVIVEIISNSTQFIDRITKWACYKTIPTLKEYILINQYTFEIEKYERKGAKEWLLTEVNKKEDIITINDISISLNDIYKNTENLPNE